MSVTVLTAYPLSQPFRSELEAQHGGVDVLTIPELRRLGATQLLQKLRGIRGPLVLAVETSSGEPALPALKALAAVTRASSIEVALRGAAPERARRASCVAALAGIAGASLDGLAVLASGELSSRRLMGTERISAQADLGAGLLLLNPSPWVGLTTGGAVAHTVGVANAFADEGVRVTVATYGETPGLRDEVRAMPLHAPRGYGLPAEINRFRFGRAASLTDLPAGVVYERASLGSTAGVSISRRLGVPLVVEYNGSEVWAARNWGGTTRFEHAASRAEAVTLRHAHLVVTVSEQLADELRARGVEGERVMWHPNGVDPNPFDPVLHDDAERSELRRRYGIPADALLVTFVGTFGHWHGAEILARVARRTATAQRAQPLYFLFIGDGPREPEVRRILSGLDSAKLAGVVATDAIPLHLAASDVLVAPHTPNPDGSSFFGSPTKLFEYMAAGKAIVASNLGQIGQVLADGAGILVIPGDEDDLLRGLEQAAADPAERAALGRRARDRVLQRYTWRHQVREIAAAIERIGR